MKVVYEHLNPNREIKVGEMVRWDEFPDRLYYVTKMNMNHCGRNDYCRIESIDHKHIGIVPITDLTWDDVDYIEVKKESGLLQKIKNIFKK